MKTLDEALDDYFKVARNIKTEHEKVLDHMNKTRSLVHEVVNNEKVYALVMCYMEIMKESPQAVLAGLMNIFAHGVCVGVEMEKQEIKE